MFQNATRFYQLVAMEIDIETQNRIARVIKVIVSLFSSKYILFTGGIICISGIIVLRIKFLVD